MQYDSAVPFLSPGSDRMNTSKPGLMLAVSSPAALRSSPETPRDSSDWPATSHGIHAPGLSSSGLSVSPTSRSITGLAPFGLKIEPPMPHQLLQQPTGAFRLLDTGRSQVTADLRPANWMWSTNTGTEAVPHAMAWGQTDHRGCSSQDYPGSGQMGFSGGSESFGHNGSMNSPWLSPDLPTYMFPTGDTPTASAAAPAPASSVSELFVNPFEGVSMPLCSPRGFPMSPVHMEGFPPFIGTCEVTTATAEAEDSLPAVATWDPRGSIDSISAFNFGRRSGSISIDGLKSPDGSGGGLLTLQTQQIATWMAARSDSIDAESARNTIPSGIRRRPRSEIITDAEYSSQAKLAGDGSYIQANSSGMTDSRTAIVHQQTAAMAQPLCSVSSSVISSHPLPVTDNDVSLAQQLVNSRFAGDETRLEGSATVQLLTPLNDCYWKNGRKNLQCFPSCPEHSDFYSMKMNNRKHSSVGVCRGPVYCHVFTAASGQQSVATPSSSISTVPGVPGSGMSTTSSTVLARHMKYELGVGASSSGGGTQELFVLGRFERVPQQQENSTVLLEYLDPPPSFSSSVAFEQFRYSCFQAVEMEERRALVPTSQPDRPLTPSASPGIMRSTWFFLPDVWKVRPMLKKKRKATRSTPAQTFPFCFRVFVYAGEPLSAENGTPQHFTCLSATASSFFELYSTRTVDRVKRRAWADNGSPTERSDGEDDPQSIKRPRVADS